MLSGLPPIATDARTSSIGSFVPCADLPIPEQELIDRERSEHNPLTRVVVCRRFPHGGRAKACLYPPESVPPAIVGLILCPVSR